MNPPHFDMHSIQIYTFLIRYLFIKLCHIDLERDEHRQPQTHYMNSAPKTKSGYEMFLIKAGG